MQLGRCLGLTGVVETCFMSRKKYWTVFELGLTGKVSSTVVKDREDK